MRRVTQDVAGSAPPLPTGPGNQGLTLDLIFHTEALAFDDDGVGMMEQPIQDRGGQGAVMVEDHGPLLEGEVGGNDDRPLFIA